MYASFDRKIFVTSYDQFDFVLQLACYFQSDIKSFFYLVYAAMHFLTWMDAKFLNS